MRALTRRDTNTRGCAFCAHRVADQKFLCQLDECPFKEFEETTFNEIVNGCGDYREFMEDWKGHRQKR